MVIIKISGGLGNQLFQYAFGKFVGKKNIEVKYDFQTELNVQNFTKRTLDLEKFKVKSPVASRTEAGHFIWFSKGILWRIERKLSQLFSINRKYQVQKNAHHLSTDITDNVYYDGYWQCYQYTDDVRDLLLDEIKPDQVFYSKYQDLLAEFKAENSVAIHIRRGDYINIPINAKIFEVCDLDYYENAIKHIKKLVNKPKFYIFTQDIEWAKENFNNNEFQIVEGGSGIDDLMLMSKCSNNIIANSTFSWWSAWLNSNKDKIVIAPRRWYKERTLNKETDNLIPRSWIRI